MALLTRPDRHRGAVAIEAALVTPIFILLLFGIIEFSFIFKDWLSVNSAVRAGARTASSEPRIASFAQDAADTMAREASALPRGQIQQLWVYKADDNGYPVGYDDKFADCSVCVKFRWDAASKSFRQTSSNWDGEDQNACPGDPAHDAVGIYLKTKHTTITKFIVSDVTLSEHAVLLLEPVSNTTQCSPVL